MLKELEKEYHERVKRANETCAMLHDTVVKAGQVEKYATNEKFQEQSDEIRAKRSRSTA